jgi:hypothetical protein
MASVRLPFLLMTVALALRRQSKRRSRKLRVMPMGDSITFGCGDGCDGQGCGDDCGVTKPPCTSGYRKTLWQMLSPAGRTSDRWDFVGSRQSGNGTQIDPRVMAHPGWQIEDLMGAAGEWLPIQPDVVMLHIGTNNLGMAGQSASEALTSMNQLVGQIVEGIPKVRLFLATLIGAYKYGSDQHEAFNSGIKHLAAVYAGRGYRVTLVDMATESGLGKACDEPFCCLIDVPGLKARVHPNQDGYDKIAAVWHKYLKDLA